MATSSSKKYPIIDPDNDMTNDLDEEEGKSPEEIIEAHIQKAESLLNSTMGKQSGITSIREFTNPEETKENRIKLIQSGLRLLQQNMGKQETSVSDKTRESEKQVAEEIAQRLADIETVTKYMLANQKQQ